MGNGFGATVERHRGYAAPVDVSVDIGDSRIAFESRVLGELAHISKRLDSLIGEVGRLKGRSLEERVRAQPAHFLRGLVSGAQVVELQDVLARLAPGALGEPDVASLERADMIAEGTLRHDGARVVQIVVEISWRLDRHDVARAFDRAKLLATGTGRPCLPAVIADDAPEATVIAIAAELGVAVINGDGIVIESGRVVNP